MKNVISQSLGLDLVNISVYAKVYQNIPLSSIERAIFTFSEFEPRQRLGQSQWHGLRVIDIFHEQAGDKIFTNGPGTKSSQTVRWQNQMFDYRALYEIQLSVSVDFLRVVQYFLSHQVLIFISKAYNFTEWRVSGKCTEPCIRTSLININIY